ncbi:TetR/AcrR family transcriptional regulator [Kutzneria sp. CA-103260]|uniref:TetR/AcrR family transcriptional regulator n=1 Tax=Kutzneria sp. CA-103260 TaxID=2802641 RepID=UPI001BAD9AD4|nr:TetR/AcrR family transcriptional regulator [Kutzneria sp. CA-103260]QUQ71561.1 TetR family transcriptional regulator [Kutzneria sp. CA-103260]
MPGRDDERGERILDAAAELVLRWGYKRVTIEDVAKHAGIGKGTVYLHFRNRAELFLSVLVRESVAMTADMLDALRRDPVMMLPAEQAQMVYLGLMKRPLLRAMFVRDVDLLGDLAVDPAMQPLRRVKVDLFGDLFQVLREHGLVRTDRDLEGQRFLLTAVQTGFYLARPVLGQLGEEHDDQATAELLAHTIREALHTPGPPDPEVLAALAPKVTAMFADFHAALAATVHGTPPRD